MRREIIVTDHAIIRWLERAMGVDMEFARRAIREAVQEAIDAGAASLTVHGVTYCMTDNRVTTVRNAATRSVAGKRAAFANLVKPC